MTNRNQSSEVWITGIGLISSLGEGNDVHVAALTGEAPAQLSLDQQRFAGYVVHPLLSVDFSRQIPKSSDQRQMDRWQRIGVYAAGLAIDDAGLRDNSAALDATDLAVAAGNGERDVAFDAKALAMSGPAGILGEPLNTQLSTGLRPTLYLGQLSNLLAGNISIVHKVTGGSRTFKGEEAAGPAALGDAYRRISSGLADRVLVGGALNAERPDLLLDLELGEALWRGPYRPIEARGEAGGGMAPGSMGVFLVLESRECAEGRGVKPYARLSGVVVDQCRRDAQGEVAGSLSDLLARLESGDRERAAPVAVLSGASGVEPATSEERQFLRDLYGVGPAPNLLTYGDVLGHGIEAHFLCGVALGALGLCNDIFPPPPDGRRDSMGAVSAGAVVTGVGHWRGEALALLQSCGGR